MTQSPTPLKERFAKFANWQMVAHCFEQDPDFILPLLIRVESNAKTDDPQWIDGVGVSSRMGNICAARASYEGLQNLSASPDVISMDI